MKKKLVIILSIVLVFMFCFSSCGNNNRDRAKLQKQNDYVKSMVEPYLTEKDVEIEYLSLEYDENVISQVIAMIKCYGFDKLDYKQMIELRNRLIDSVVVDDKEMYIEYDFYCNGDDWIVEHDHIYLNDDEVFNTTDGKINNDYEKKSSNNNKKIRYMEDMTEEEIENCLVYSRVIIKNNLAYNPKEAQISYYPSDWIMQAEGDVYTCATTIQACNAYGTLVTTNVAVTFTMTDNGFENDSCVFEE